MTKLQSARRSVLAGSLLLLFLVMTVVPAGALIVLGLKLASQDRILLGQRIAELRQADLDRAVHALAAEVQSWQQVLAARDFRGAASLPADSAVILVVDGEARALPPGRMLWSPLPARMEPASSLRMGAGSFTPHLQRESKQTRIFSQSMFKPDRTTC